MGAPGDNRLANETRRTGPGGRAIILRRLIVIIALIGEAFGLRQMSLSIDDGPARWVSEPRFPSGGSGNIVGQSPALRNIVQQIELVAPTDANVLILGESGSGKELVAQEIYRRSERTARAMVRVNCASVPRELYESEFFVAADLLGVRPTTLASRIERMGLIRPASQRHGFQGSF